MLPQWHDTASKDRRARDDKDLSAAHRVQVQLNGDIRHKLKRTLAKITLVCSAYSVAGNE